MLESYSDFHFDGDYATLGEATSRVVLSSFCTPFLISPSKESSFVTFFSAHHRLLELNVHRSSQFLCCVPLC